jgi:hypothetical protein
MLDDERCEWRCRGAGASATCRSFRASEVCGYVIPAQLGHVHLNPQSGAMVAVMRANTTWARLNVFGHFSLTCDPNMINRDFAAEF